MTVVLQNGTLVIILKTDIKSYHSLQMLYTLTNEHIRDFMRIRTL